MINRDIIKDLTDFWSEAHFLNDTFIHEDDFPLLEGKLVDNCRDFEEYIRYYLDNPKDTCFHPNLRPVPYCGDLEKAKVFILSLNPGFGCDYFFEKDAEFFNALKNNLSQKNLDSEYPLCYLNPKFSGTGGAQYWYKKFDPVIKRLMRQLSISYTEALKIIAKKTVLLESVPYHSKEFQFSGYAKLASVQVMRDFVNNYVVPNAEQGNCLLIVLRKGTDLQDKGFNLNGKNIIVYKGGECRGASLKTRKTYEKIVKFLNL